MSLKWQAGHAENIYVLYNHFGDIRVKKAVLEKKKKRIILCSPASPEAYFLTPLIE